jgi:threonylcarbamoyladenosine tRNA methylthiotransferase CDKAL1
MRVAFVTFGCSVNFADSELMMGLLQRAGYSIIDDPGNADLVVINGCSVKHLAEKKFFRAIAEYKNKGKRIVLAGCVVQAEPGYAASLLKDYSIIGTRQLNSIVHVVEETLHGNVVHCLDMGRNVHLNLPRIRRNDVIGIVPISEGCLGDCSYCKARLARGKLVSYNPNEIVKQVISDVNDGCREIWLTSQDCGAYGKDIGTSIIALLRAVLDIKGDFIVRLGMMNPNFAIEYLDELIEIFKQGKGKLFRFIHIPVQSGNDRMLGLMGRKYRVGDFIEVCEKMRKAMPDITIDTDIICGFPTEKEEEFNDSLELVKRIKPDVLNISRFWARPGTEAANMEGQLIGRETNPRSRELRKVFNSIAAERKKQWQGWSGRIVIDEKGKIGRSESWIGRNYAYVPVAVRGKHLLGEKLVVKVDKTGVHHLEAIPLSHQVTSIKVSKPPSELAMKPARTEEPGI